MWLILPSANSITPTYSLLVLLAVGGIGPPSALCPTTPLWLGR